MAKSGKQLQVEAAICKRFDVGRLLAFRLVTLWQGGQFWDRGDTYEVLLWAVRNVRYMSLSARGIIRLDVTERRSFKAGCTRRLICGKQWLRLDKAIKASYQP